MINDFLVWFLDYVQYFLILPLLAGIYNFKYLKGESLAIFYYVLIAIFFEILSRTLMYLKFRNTLPMLHLYTVIEFSVFWLFYFRFFKLFYSQKAMKILLGGEPVRATEALAMGLVSEVVPLGELQARAAHYAQNICRQAPLALQAIKRTALETHTLPWADAMVASSRSPSGLLSLRYRQRVTDEASTARFTRAAPYRPM